MSYNRPTLSTLIERARGDINSRLTGADARLRRNVLDVLTRVHAAGMNDLYAYASWIARQIVPETADSDVLARHAARWGVIKKAATFAAGSALASGTNGLEILAGTLFTRIDGAQYRSVSSATISGGTATLALEAVASGTGFGVETGQSLTFIELMAGVNATLTVEAPGIVDGAGEESDESLLYRLLARMQTPPQGGSAADYRLWALDQPGVTRAWVYSGWLGDGTVGLTFVMDGRTDIIPEAGDIAAVQAALDDLRPVTADLTVFAPIPLAVPITLSINPSTAAVEAAVITELDDLFVRDSEPGGIIRRSRISEAVSIATGEEYHELTLPASDVVTSGAQLPVRGAVTFL